MSITPNQLEDLRDKDASHWPAELFADILDAASRIRGKFRDTPRKRWWRAFLLVARDTRGQLTRPQIVDIRWAHLTPDCVLVTPVGDPPTDRVFRLQADTAAALEAIRKPVRRMVFRFARTTYTDRMLAADWEKILKAVELPPKALWPTRRMRLVVPDLPTSQPAEPNDQRLIDFYREVYSPLKLRSRSPRTYRLYDFTIRNFGRYLEREPMLSDLTDDQVIGMLAWMTERKRSPYSVEKERCQLLAIWRFAHQRHAVSIWPNVHAERRPKQVHLAWTPEELDKLFSALRELPGKVGDIPAADWWYALHCVIWDTGERIGAVLALTWNSVDLDSRWIVIPSELRKGKTEDKASQLHPTTVEAMHAIRRPTRELIFPWPSCQTLIYHHYTEILKAAGLPHDGKSKFHRLRRSVASHFEAAGGNATELLGHTSRSVTQRHYLDPRIVKVPQASELLFRPAVEKPR